jgi:hypothetical protein
VSPPEFGRKPKNADQQIAAKKVTGRKRIVPEALQREWNQILHADVLPNHDAQIFNRELAKRHAA